MNIDQYIDRATIFIIETNKEYRDIFIKSIEYRNVGRSLLVEKFSWLKLSNEKCRLIQHYFRGVEGHKFSKNDKLYYGYARFIYHLEKNDLECNLSYYHARYKIDPSKIRAYIYYYYGLNKYKIDKKIKTKNNEE